MDAPQKAQSPVAAGQSANKSTNTAIVAPAEKTGKQIATLKAEMALRGHAVFDLADGAFLVTRWGLTRRCADITELAAFARQIGGDA